jgi:predicted PurR-regulated permease PerM
LIVALIQFKSLGPLANILLLYASIKLLDIFVIQPLAVGRGKEIHPALLIASIIIGGHTLGIFGMIIAVPTVTIIQRIFGLVFRGSARSSWHIGRAAAGPEIPPFVC